MPRSSVLPPWLIALHLAATRGDAPDVLENLGHFLYLHPDVVAAYVEARSRTG